MTPGWCVVGLFCGGVLIGTSLRAAEDPVDADLLEFLGSVDSSVAGWYDYLAVTNVDKLAKSAAAASAPTAVPGNPSGATAPAGKTGKVQQP